MRNLTFLATPELSYQAACFRRAFMENTAVWHVGITECSTADKVQLALQGKEHAFIAAPRYRALLLEKATAKGASTKLSQGADVLYRGGSGYIGLSQLGRAIVDCLENKFIPLYGARVVILGAGGAALDLAYECARAGVDKVVLLDEDKGRAQQNLEVFLETFSRIRTSILDTEQAREGHVSATRAYEDTAFLFGSLQALSSIKEADICFSMLPSSASCPNLEGAIHVSQIVCDPWGRNHLLQEVAQQAACDFVPTEEIMAYWGRECAELLIEFGNAQLD